jgi:hypothetical protein
LDPNTDIRKIVSENPISRDSTSNIDLYTYFPDAESASTNSPGNIQETQSAANILKTMKQSAVRQEIGLPIHTSHTTMAGPPSTPIYHISARPPSTPIYHISAPNPQSYHAPSPQSQVFDRCVGIQDSFDKLATSNSGNSSVASFTPTNGATEAAGFQFQIQGQGEANMMDVAPVARGIDGTDLWWDQNFDEFETDLFGFLHGEYPWNEGSNYFVYG